MIARRSDGKLVDQDTEYKNIVVYYPSDMPESDPGFYRDVFPSITHGDFVKYIDKSGSFGVIPIEGFYPFYDLKVTAIEDVELYDGAEFVEISDANIASGQYNHVGLADCLNYLFDLFY